MSARLRGSKSELQELGEDTDFLAQGVSSLSTEIEQLSGINIMVDDSTFKSTYDIFNELSQVYDKLSETSQARITELLGGKNQANIVSALLEDFGVARDVYARAPEADGSANKELESALDSIDGKLNQLSATWQKFSTDLLDSEVVKFGIDFLNGVVSALDDIGGSIGHILTSLPAIVGIIQGIRGKTGADEPRKHRVLIMCPQFITLLYNRTTGV